MSMELINARSQIRNVAERWHRHYPRGGRYDNPGRAAIREALDRIDPETATADEIHAIIGNTSWAEKMQECDNCGRHVPAVVRIGQPMDYESSTANVCADCLREALALIEGAASDHA